CVKDPYGSGFDSW
nr:immunoglobulin heavy chain junction region [Macaca mulatta]